MRHPAAELLGDGRHRARHRGRRLAELDPALGNIHHHRLRYWRDRGEVPTLAASRSGASNP